MEGTSSDEQFFEQLYFNYEQNIFYVAYSILNNQEQAEDVTQDIFEHLYKNLPKLKKYDTLRLKKYILRISKNKSIDRYRRNKNEQDYKAHLPQQVEVDNQLEVYLKKLISDEKFLQIKEQLNEPYRQVFMYRIYYDFSTKETAEMMNIRVETVKKQFERAKAKVKVLLEGEKENE